jgi:ferritin-like metal-binding protein YciE
LDQEGADAVLDAAFIAGCQRVEHYEITAYGSLMAWAQVLGYSEALELLKANEAEEKAADAKLTKLAESTINRQARAAGDQRHNEQPRKQLSSRR